MMKSQWQNDPKYWKFHFFYFNPEDKNIFPPKRIPGIGWTINFANPKSILAFLIMIAFFAFVVYMIESKN
jgi:uncharacterized membrane protein